MATMKTLLRKRNIKSNHYPVIIRVIHNRKVKEITVPDVSIKEEHWDDQKEQIKAGRSDPFYARAAILNSQINKFRRKIEKAIDELHLSGDSFTVNDIYDKTFGKKKDLTQISFLKYCEEYVESNPDELAIGTLKYYRTTINNWRKCHGQLKLKDITKDHIIKFRKFLKKEGLTVNSSYTRLKTVRKMVRKALKEEVLDNDPFIHISLKQEKGNREYLTMEEINRLIAVQPSSSCESLTKDVFLFSCYTGLRFGDICRLKKKHFKSLGPGKLRLSIRMAKTRETISFNLPDKASRIVDKYKPEAQEEYLFPFLRNLRNDSERSIASKISSANATTNRYIKDLVERAKIKKHISCHCGRHSFSVNSLAMGADIYVLSKILGHSSVATTEIYAKVVDARKDELIELWN